MPENSQLRPRQWAGDPASRRYIGHVRSAEIAGGNKRKFPSSGNDFISAGRSGARRELLPFILTDTERDRNGGTERWVKAQWK